MGLFDRFRSAPPDPYERFWSWFVRNKDRVARMIDDRTIGLAAYEELTTEMKRVHEHLMPELTRDKDGTNVLVISADGRREAVEPVMQLAKAAPDLPGWRIQRFRSPGPEDMRIHYPGAELVPASMRVAYRVDDAKRLVHVGMVMPGPVKDDKQMGGLALLCLDHTIGEYNTIMHVGRIDLLAPEEVPPNAALLTLVQLRELIEQRFY
jgi:hypothetical protein